MQDNSTIKNERSNPMMIEEEQGSHNQSPQNSEFTLNQTIGEGSMD